jgi:hypothetical protein
MLPTPLTSNPNERMDAVTLLLHAKVVKALRKMMDTEMTGQMCLNMNRGEIQSFEVKEHTRI